MLRIILAKDYKNAVKVVSDGNEWVAIETEYGQRTLDDSVPGVVLSLNHHGELQEELPPAMVYQTLDKPVRYDNFIISHIDLDTLFGILWTAGWLKKTKVTKKLSDIIGAADNLGFHRIDSIIQGVDKDIVDKYYAIGYLLRSWVIHDKGHNVKDVSKELHKLLLRIKDVIMDGPPPELTFLVEEWFSKKNDLAQKYLLSVFNLCDKDRLFIFRAPYTLVNAYRINNLKAKIIIHYNEQSKSITLSCYDEETAIKYFGKEGVLKPLRQFFGDKAGGKITIGGTPRDQQFQPEMIMAFFKFLLREYLNVPNIINLREQDVSNHCIKDD
jgi:hypothetical protein